VSDNVTILLLLFSRYNICIRTYLIPMLFLSYRTFYISVVVMWHRSVGLTVRKICGELKCPEYYMCQSHDLQCYPCHSYCNQTSHNFDAHICEQQCQGTFIEPPLLISHKSLSQKCAHKPTCFFYDFDFWGLEMQYPINTYYLHLSGYTTFPKQFSNSCCE